MLLGHFLRDPASCRFPRQLLAGLAAADRDPRGPCAGGLALSRRLRRGCGAFAGWLRMLKQKLFDGALWVATLIGGPALGARVESFSPSRRSSRWNVASDGQCWLSDEG